MQTSVKMSNITLSNLNESLSKLVVVQHIACDSLYPNVWLSFRETGGEVRVVLLDSNMHYGFSSIYIDARIKFPSFVCIHVWRNSVLSFWINHNFAHFFSFHFCHFLYFLFLAVIFLILCNLLSFSLKPFETYNTCEPQSNAFEEFFLRINSYDFFVWCQQLWNMTTSTKHLKKENKIITFFSTSSSETWRNLH